MALFFLSFGQHDKLHLHSNFKSKTNTLICYLLIEVLTPWAVTEGNSSISLIASPIH